MKHTIYTIALGSMLLFTSVASASELELRARASTTPAQVKLEVKERMEEKRASSTEKKAELEVRKASSTEKRIEMQQGLAKRKAEMAGKLLEATITRLEKIATRLDSRIAKVKAEGGMTAESEAFSAQAKVHLSEARQSLAVFASIDLSADKAQANFAKVKEAAKDVRTHIKEAHESLMQAVRALKPGSVNAHATTTASTTAQ
jgi:hypothetical protein